jgi:hypothetical protein
MTTTGITQFSNTRIFPLTYVLKYDPPMIGMVYKSNEKDPKRRIYKIYLHGLIYKNDPEAITRQLFQEHTLHINENNVSHKQVKSLVTKLLQHRERRSEGNSPSAAKTGINAQRSDFLHMGGGQGFGQSKGKVQQQGNKYQYQDDNLEFDGEIEDLEHEEQRGSYGSGSQKSGEKKYAGKLGILKGLAEQKAAQNQANDEMDFILDDPDNLDNLSDY